MIEKQINHHAGHRNVQPNRKYEPSETFVFVVHASESAPQSSDDEWTHKGSKNRVRR